MRLTFVLLLNASLASAGTLYRRQDGPVAPGTATDCTYYDTARSERYTCAFFEENWGLTHEQFVDYANPSIGQDCSGIIIGNSYCVEVNFGLPRPTTRPPQQPTRTATTQLTSTITNGPSKPSPTQEGLAADCTEFYFAQNGESCQGIVDRYGGTFTLEQFYWWNPAVGSSCGGLWADTYYCVGVLDTPTTRPATTTTAAPTGPSPTQPGLAADCTSFYFAKSGDTCQAIVDGYNTFTLADFYKWNPAVNPSCAGLWADTYYCVGVPGTPTTRPTTTTAAPTTTAPVGPSPTQQGIVAGCTR